MKKILGMAIIVIMGLTSCNSSTGVQNEKIEISNETTDKTTKDVNENNIIWEFVQNDVAKNLNFPDSAEFDDISKAKFYTISDDTTEVIGVVKGQNTLGNIISNNFCATVLIDTDGLPTIVSNVEFIGNETLEEKIELNNEIENRKINEIEFLTENELNDIILTQPLYVKETNFIDSDSLMYSNNSMMQAVLFNNSDVPIKNAIIGFCSWDKNGLPIKIKGYISISEGEYFKIINYDEINLMPNETFTGKQGDTFLGMSVEKDLNVNTIKAIVVSYEDFDGNEWKNPNLLDFKKLYEEKRIVQ